MSESPEFIVTRNGRRLHGIILGASLVQHAYVAEVLEVQAYGFEVRRREVDSEYSVWIGDVAVGSVSVSDRDLSMTSSGIGRGDAVVWDDSRYFEGARGLVWIRVASRPAHSDIPWRDRALLPILVASSKLSEEQYYVMFEQLRSLAAGLVHDLVSKSLRGVELSDKANRIRVRSSHAELQILEKVWPPIAESLQRVSREPTTRLTSAHMLKNCWGSERFGTRALARLASMGVDPRKHGREIPFTTTVECILESNDTTEHRVIRGFLEFLLYRLDEFCRKIDSDIESFDQHRQWRERLQQPGSSLFQLEDRPRVRRLQERRSRAEQLSDEIRRACTLGPLRGVRPSFRLTETPVFRNVGPYQRIHREMIRYLSTGLVIIDEGSDERIKSTSRMYEQWVFLQLAAALKTAGLRCNSQFGVLHHARRARFIVDIERGASVSFSVSGDTSIRLRYEPWIMPFQQARQTLDTLFFGRAGQSALSPDIVLEVLSGRESVGSPAHVNYAIVIDAKYTRAIREHHWTETAKYLRVQSTASAKQVVRQLWLVHPSSEGLHISFRDNAFDWTNDGPSCAPDDVVEGMLQLAPATELQSDELDSGWIGRPEPGAMLFIGGLLRFLQIDLSKA